MVAASALRDSLPCVAFEDIRIICYPVKWEWHEDADMDLIVDSARHMMDIIKDIGITHIYSVKPGCGNGGLRWGQVQAKLAGIFDNRVTIVDVPENRAKR